METFKITNRLCGLLMRLPVLVCIVMPSLLFGCSSTRLASLSVHRDSTSSTVKTGNTFIGLTAQRDSIYARDSIYEYHEYKGDTVTNYIYKFRTEYRERPTKEVVYAKQTDTLVVHKTVFDSIEVPVEVAVEKPLTPWQRHKLRFGGYAESVVLAEVLVLCLYFYRRKK